MKIRLIHKFSPVIDGIDLSAVAEGDTIDVPVRDALILIAEGWAVHAGGPDEPDRADDRPGRRRRSRQSGRKNR